MYQPQEVERVLLSEEELKARVKQLGEQLAAEYNGKNPLFLCVLKGAVVFFADLIRNVGCPLEIDFLRASSYGASDVGGELKLDMGCAASVKGRHVVVVEDILDTGNTLFTLKNELLKREPASVKIVTLLDKPSRREVKGFSADLCGFEIEDYFVVGYGLDYAEKFRYLPYIGVAVV